MQRRDRAVWTAEAILAIARSGLFDPEWYLAKYERARGESLDPLVHFCDVGWRAGLRPNCHFDTLWYLETNPDVARYGINPLLHYLQDGDREDRRPAPHFDVAWYRRRYGIGRDRNCLAHHLAHRRLVPTSPCRGFDAGFYLSRYAGLVGDRDAHEHYAEFGAPAGLCATADAQLIHEARVFDTSFYRAAGGKGANDAELIGHFCDTGWRDGIDPNRVFDCAAYLERNPDIRAAGHNPLLHYLRAGHVENRPISPHFDAAQYGAVHGLARGDVALVDAARRASRFAELAEQIPDGTCPEGDGQAAAIELVRLSGLVDENSYLIDNPDVRETGMPPLEHFFLYGERENRRPNPYFDPGWYRRVHAAPDGWRGNTLLHYVLSGEARGNRPIAWFDPAWYQAAYGICTAISPLLHYLRHRRSQAFSPNALFDIGRYAVLEGPRIGPNRDLFSHYLRLGISRDIDPGPDFDAGDWRRRRMDLARPPWRGRPGEEVHERTRRERLNPLVHFLLATLQPDPDRSATEVGPAVHAPGARPRRDG